MQQKVKIWFQKSKSHYFQNLFAALFGLKTIIGYNPSDSKLSKLPLLKPAIILIGYNQSPDFENNERVHKNNLIYAKNYTIYKDFDILWNRYNTLGFKK